MSAQQRILIRYKDYDSHVRTRIYMGPVNEPAENVGSLLMRKQEFDAFLKLVQTGASQYTEMEVVLEEVEEFTADVTKVGKE
jgi:nucleosome binding factor SPN SPT16 subunit